MTKFRVWLWRKISGVASKFTSWTEQKLLNAQLDIKITHAERNARLEALLKTL